MQWGDYAWNDVPRVVMAFDAETGKEKWRDSATIDDGTESERNRSSLWKKVRLLCGHA